MANKFLTSVKLRRMELVVIAFMNLVYFFSYFQRVAVPGSIFDQLQRDFDLSSASVSLLGGIMFYIYGGMQVFAGYAIDRFGAYGLMIIGGSLVSVGSTLFPLSNGELMLFATRILVGLGASLIYLSIVKTIDARFHDRNFSILLSISMFVGYMGGLFGTAPFEFMVRLFTWRTALLIMGAGCSLSVILAAVFSGKAPVTRKRQVSEPIYTSLKRILKNPASYPPIILESIVFGTYFVMQSTIGKKLMMDCRGVSSSMATNFTFAMMLTSSTSAVVSGFISRWMGNRRKPILIAATVFSSLAGITILTGLAFHASAYILLIGYMLFGASSCASVIADCSMKELNYARASATSVGVVNCTAYIGVAVLATVAGLILARYRGQAVVTADAIRYPIAAYKTFFIGMTALSLAAFAASLFLRETRGRNIYDENTGAPNPNACESAT